MRSPLRLTKCFQLYMVALLIYSPASQAMERSASLINSFEVMCMTRPLNFSETDAQATTMKLPIVQDTKTPKDAEGHYVHQKVWVLPLNNGPHAFMAAEGFGPKGYLKSCGIADNDVNGANLKTELIKTVSLGKPTYDAVAQDGIHHTTKWALESENEELILIVPAPTQQKGGMYLTLIGLTAKP